jgi:hypothetical protein
MSKERQQKLGRRVELKEMQQAMRIEIDLLVRAVRDLFEPRDVELAYTEKIDTTRMMIYMKEIERKHRALAKVCKEIAILDDELDGEQ